MGKMKLTYFSHRGPGERLRYILYYAGADFEDLRLPSEEWKALKPTAPTGTVPFFEDDGKVIGQSMAIARYLGKKFGLMGKDDYENAVIDMAVDYGFDSWEAITPAYSAKFGNKGPEALKEAMETFKEKKWNAYMDFLTKLLDKSGSGYLFGDKVTWGDFVIAEYLDRADVCFDSTVMDNHPKVKAFRDRIQNLPNLKKYIDTRPEKGG